MSCYALRNVEFQPLYRHLLRDPKVRTGHHRCLHGVVYLVRTGIPWRELPPRFGHWNSVCRRFRNRVWERLLQAMADERADLSRMHLESSHVRCHVSAVVGAGGPEAPTTGAATAPSFMSWSHRRAAACAPDPGPGRRHAPGRAAAGGPTMPLPCGTSSSRREPNR